MRVLLLLCAAASAALAILYHIDQPVPVSLGHGQYYVSARLWGSGGVLTRLGVGLFDRVTLGMSYSVNRLIGAEAPQASRPRPEFIARASILKEEGYLPDLAVGFESQGFDDYDGAQFAVREKGVFVALGKTIDATRTYCELGANWWDGMDGFVAVNQLLPGAFELMLEYDPALNDIRSQQWRGGFVNLGVAWTFAEHLRVGLSLRDILGCRDETRLNRVVDVAYTQHF